MAVAYTDTPVKKTKLKSEAKRKKEQELKDDGRGKKELSESDDRNG